jgi:hypothetical protein
MNGKGRKAKTDERELRNRTYGGNRNPHPNAGSVAIQLKPQVPARDASFRDDRFQIWRCPYCPMECGSESQLYEHLRKHPSNVPRRA